MTRKNINFFRRFLKDKNLLVQFEYYLNIHLKNYQYDDIKTIPDYYEHTKECYILVHAFHWIKTKEGYIKWCEVDKEWRYKY